jgi:hypothetical protein
VPQVNADRRRARPVLHRGRHSLRRVRPGHGATAASAADHLVLGDLGPRLGNLRDLPPDHALFQRAGQDSRSAGTAGGLVPQHLVGKVAELHRHTGLSLRPAGLPPGPSPRGDVGAGFASPSDDGGLELFLEFCPVFAARSATCA